MKEIGNRFEGVVDIDIHLCTIETFLFSVCTILLTSHEPDLTPLELLV